MDYIREYCRTENICLVRTNTQGRSAAHLLKLLRMATADFRGLDINKIKLIRVKNAHKNQSYGWEFKPTGSVPESYQIIENIPRLPDPLPPIDEKLLPEPDLQKV